MTDLIPLLKTIENNLTQEEFQSFLETLPEAQKVNRLYEYLDKIQFYINIAHPMHSAIFCAYENEVIAEEPNDFY
jgi:hypothetical protein